jgi:hypothetical protein
LMERCVSHQSPHSLLDRAAATRWRVYGEAAYSDEKVANREIRVWHFVIENGYRMMDKSKTPRHKVRERHDPKWVGGVLDSSIIQGAFSVAPCQTLVSRFATFPSLHGAGAAAAGHGQRARGGVQGAAPPRRGRVQGRPRAVLRRAAEAQQGAHAPARLCAKRAQVRRAAPSVIDHLGGANRKIRVDTETGP